MHWALLAAAIALEVFATSMLKISDGFTRLWPTVSVLAGYALSFFLLSRVLQTMPVGTAYAIWSAAGTVLVVGIGFVAYHERLTSLQLIGVALTIAGVVLLNVGGAAD
ncbi:DMT family transporter [Leucobacter aridicollis]|uniref:DMT family transporter n=1 Tax=Leucobacter aridicollis TaxID=283878 RepID=UPI000E655CEF|nr:multidrug efflux SMR transporter [Leucobacter aridicollis]UTX54423.1 multidrug efflux SMR transporter [Leucobacter aridicollis]